MTRDNRYVLLVPHYNHLEELKGFLPRLKGTGLPLLIVDDGSDGVALAALRNLAGADDAIHLACHRQNRGKGAAVLTGLAHARQLGYTHAIQIDADGQHDAGDVARFISLSRERPDAFVCGKPVFDDSVPKARLHGRKVTTVFAAIETLSLQIKDGLCGYRVYPLDVTERLRDRYYLGPRMDFDTEILVKAVWEGVTLDFRDTAVKYPEGGASHFNYLRDNLTLVRLHTRLLAGMLIRLPRILVRRLPGMGS